jgi:hypothetical protein
VFKVDKFRACSLLRPHYSVDDFCVHATLFDNNIALFSPQQAKALGSVVFEGHAQIQEV